jgi:hypothetical protein
MEARRFERTRHEGVFLPAVVKHRCCGIVVRCKWIARVEVVSEMATFQAAHQAGNIRISPRKQLTRPIAAARQPVVVLGNFQDMAANAGDCHGWALFSSRVLNGLRRRTRGLLGVARPNCKSGAKGLTDSLADRPSAALTPAQAARCAKRAALYPGCSGRPDFARYRLYFFQTAVQIVFRLCRRRSPNRCERTSP